MDDVAPKNPTVNNTKIIMIPISIEIAIMEEQVVCNSHGGGDSSNSILSNSESNSCTPVELLWAVVLTACTNTYIHTYLSHRQDFCPISSPTSRRSLWKPPAL